MLANTVALLAPAALGAPVVPQAAAAGDTITGTVTAQSNGAPLAGMHVQLFDAQYGAGILVTETTTDSNGEYTLTGNDLCGTVFVQDPTGALAYRSVWQCGSGIANLTMAPGGTLTVTVTADDNGEPIEGSCVYALLFDSEDTPTPNACTDAAGHAVLGLVPGYYRIEAVAPGGSPFIGGRYDHMGQYEDGRPVPVGPARSVSAAISLLRGHQVSGTVVADDTGVPLAGVSVSVGDWSSLPGTSAAATTDATGHFETTGLIDGDYEAFFSAFDGTYTSGVASVPVTVAGSDVTGVDGRVARGVTVEGTVTDGSGNPFEGVCLGNGTDSPDCHFTDVNGHYSWGGWSPEYGAYLTIYQEGYSPYWSEVELPLEVNTHDITLHALGHVSGHVTIAAGGAPVTSGRVAAIAVGDTDLYPADWADVGPDGAFEFTNLYADDFTFQYLGQPDSLLADEFYGGSPTFAGAAVVTVELESTTTGIDIALDPGGTLSGTVTDQTGAPLPGATVTAAGEFTGEHTATTASDGTYTIHGLQTGAVSVHFDGPAIVPGYQTEYYDEATYGSGLDVGVTIGQPTNGIDADLQRLARITGTLVDDATDAPMPFFVGLQQPVTGTFVDVSGGGYGAPGGSNSYFIDVEPGSYVVQASPTFGRRLYHEGATDLASATVVTVAAGETLSGIDFRTQQPAGPTFTPLAAPQRLVDTRSAQLGLLELPTGSLGSDLAVRMAPMVPQRFVVSEAGGLPLAAEGVAFNITAVNPSAKGYLTMYPCASTATAVPSTSTLNFRAGVTIANSTTLQPDATGGVCVVASKATDVILDATGSLDDRFVALPTPQRLLDTRAGETGLIEMPDGSLGGDFDFRFGVDQYFQFDLGGIGGVPEGHYMALNVVAVNPSAKGYLTVYPCEGVAPPATSTLNFTAGVTIANSIIVLGSPSLCVRTSQETDVIIDVTGYFEDGFLGGEPVRLLDSRTGQTGELEQPGGSLGADLAAPFQPNVPQRFVLLGPGPDVFGAGYALNITAVNPAAKGYLTVYPCASVGTPVPATSTLNFSKGITIANAQIIDPDPSNGLCVVASQATHLIVDATGTFE